MTGFARHLARLFVLMPRDRSRSPKRQHRSHSSGHNRPPAVAFPPDPSEKAHEVVDRIFRSYGLQDDFPKEVADQVEALCKREEDPSLTDLTDRPYITIDNDHSMDLDQAMWITHADPPHTDRYDWGAPLTSNPSHILVSYALADGAYYVPVNTPLFDTSLARGGSSFYLPTKCIPMLPRELSEDRMSLNANVRRRALVFDMYLDMDTCATVRTVLTWATVQSRWKGTYREAADYFEGRRQFDNQKYIADTLDLLKVVGTKRIALAEERQVIRYRRDHSRIDINDKGQFYFASSSRYISEDYNEKISVLANAEGARILREMDEREQDEGQDVVHPIFRSQEGPRPEQVDTLEQVIKTVLQSHGMDEKEWGWDRKNISLAHYLEQLRDKEAQSDGVSAVIQVIERQAVITNVAASFSTTPDGHHSLKLSEYARFSSPMREIVGCFTHKELKEAMTGELTEGLTIKADLQIRKKVIRAAEKAKQRQKKIGGALFLHMMNTIFYKDLQIRSLKDRPFYTGVVMGMDFSARKKSSRIYVKLQDPPMEVKVAAEDLNDQFECRYAPTGETFGRHGTTVEIAPLEGSYDEDADIPIIRAGDKVALKVSDYAQFYGNTSRSRWIFHVTML